MIKGIIGIPMGDPSGIGPEIIAKCLNDKGVYDLVKPVVIGNRRIMNRVLIDNSINLKINVAKTIEECRFNYGTVDIIEVDDHLDIDEFAYGKESAIYGKASYNYIEKATELALNDEIDAMVTPPINKVSLNMAGILDLGHTELLEKFTGRKNTLTMFQVHDLKVFFYTRHVSLKKACDLVKKEKLKRFFDQVFEGLNLLGFDEPKVVVAGLNPHCGDNGLFGNEEKKK